MKIIRATTLEAFRRFTVNDYINFDTESQLVESLSGEFKGNNLTKIGSAFHYLIENHANNPTEKEMIEKFGVVFAKEHYNIAFSHAIGLGVYTPEIRLNKAFCSNYGEIILTGQTDVLQGIKIRDTKVTFKPRDLDYYQQSIQWKIYLSIFGLDIFNYDIFEIQGYSDEMLLDVSKCNINQYEPIELYRFETMETEITSLINSFLDWVNYRDLWGKLTEVKL